MTAGEKVRQARERAGLSHVQLARKMYIGAKYIMDVEAGRQQMTGGMRGWMEKILGCRPGELKGENEDAGDTGNDGGADADGGSDGGDRPHGGGSAAAQAH